MPDLLIELFSEEIPARMQRKASSDLEQLFTEGISELGLTYESSASFSTPRRLTCLLYTSPSPRDGLLSRMPSSA